MIPQNVSNYFSIDPWRWKHHNPLKHWTAHNQTTLLNIQEDFNPLVFLQQNHKISEMCSINLRHENCNTKVWAQKEFVHIQGPAEIPDDLVTQLWVEPLA